MKKLQERIPSIQDIERILAVALDRFYKEDGVLLQEGNELHELSVTFRLGIYLAELFHAQFPLLNFDSEYNRHGKNPKGNPCPECEGRTCRPDFILHKRGKDESNILVIEVKKKKGEDPREDKAKLRGLCRSKPADGADAKSSYGYSYGICLVLGDGRETATAARVFYNAEKNAPSVEQELKRLFGCEVEKVQRDNSVV